MAEAQQPQPATDGSPELRDACGRRLRYLRVSLTDRCNFRCLYCMPEEGVPKLKHEDMLRLEELAAVVGVMVADLGLTKVRLTGGEPLIRRGLLDFIRSIAALPDLADLALTTNGYLLESMAGDLRRAGVRRLNVSLDTLRRERFQRLTGVDGLEQVLRGLAAARAAGFAGIKLNAVMLRENLDEAVDLLRFGLAEGLTVRFIELMPSHASFAGQFVSADELRRTIEREFTLVPLPATDRAGSAELYRIDGQGADGAAATCGFIAPITRPFCGGCDRLRLRGDGALVPCLSEPAHHDLKAFVRPEFRREALIEYIRGVVGASKARPPAQRHIRRMSQIGG